MGHEIADTRSSSRRSSAGSRNSIPETGYLRG